MPITEYIWDPVTDAYLMEKDGAGNTTAVYTQEPVPYGNLISQRRDGQTYQALQDGLGSIRQLTDETGAVTDSYTYTAFGETVSPPGPTVNPFRWLGNVGYYHDDATGSYYVRARNYAPATGRWTSTDPLMFVDGNNLYVAYFIPGKTDPSGEAEPVTVCILVVAGVCLLLSGCGAGRRAALPYYPGSRNKPKIDKALDLIDKCLQQADKTAIGNQVETRFQYDDDTLTDANVTIAGSLTFINTECSSHNAGDVAMAILAEYWRLRGAKGASGQKIPFPDHDKELQDLNKCLCALPPGTSTADNPRRQKEVQHQDPGGKTGTIFPPC